MVGELITLPLRVGVRVTQLWLRAGVEVTGLVANVAGQVLDREKHDVRDGAEVRPERDDHPGPASREGAEGGPTAVTRATRRVPRRLPKSPGATPPTEGRPSRRREEPSHVSEEPELVEEFAEPGAENGAGAQVHVHEPWDGYERSNAREVIARLATATPAQLAAVQLYESGHRGRQTILAAVEREMRGANGSGSPTQERNR